MFTRVSVVHQEIQVQVDQRSAARGQISGTLNKCILLALLIAISVGFGHFCGEPSSSLSSASVCGV